MSYYVEIAHPLEGTHPVPWVRINASCGSVAAAHVLAAKILKPGLRYRVATDAVNTVATGSVPELKGANA